jgi:mannose-6-phosphate isomerase-like protein (cupin superfamily)
VERPGSGPCRVPGSDQPGPDSDVLALHRPHRAAALRLARAAQAPQAEVYRVLEGTGVVVLDGAEHAVTGGSVVFVPGDTEHGIRNTTDEPLRFVYAFATDSVEDVVYRFSADA